MIIKRLILLQILILAFGAAYPQNCDRFTDDYIPKNLNDAIEYLNCTWSEKDKEEFKAKDEDEAVTELHFGTGLGIRNGWDLWKGRNSLSRYFRLKGISHPDDMSSIVLTSFHRSLNNKDIDLTGQIKFYKSYWSAARKEYKEKNKQLAKINKEEFSRYSIGDTVRIAFKVNVNRKTVYAYGIQKYPDLEEQPNCYIEGVVKGKRIHIKRGRRLKILLTDICGYKEAVWGGLDGTLRVGQEYYFNIGGYKIYRD